MQARIILSKGPNGEEACVQLIDGVQSLCIPCDRAKNVRDLFNDLQYCIERWNPNTRFSRLPDLDQR